MSLNHERSIVWLEDPTKYPYLRESEEVSSNRRGFSGRPSAFVMRPGSSRTRVVGYATQAEHVKRTRIVGDSDMFTRRFWYIKSPNDPFDYPGCPCEGRKVSSIKVAQESEWGRDF